MTSKTRKSLQTLSYSDIDLNRWREYDHVLTNSLWLMESRDRTGGHRLDHHGSFIPQAVPPTYLHHINEYGIALDLVLGSGTSAIEAVRLNRGLVGVELKTDLVEAVRAKVPPDLLDDRIRLLHDDSTATGTAGCVQETLNETEAITPNCLSFTHPTTVWGDESLANSNRYFMLL